MSIRRDVNDLRRRLAAMHLRGRNLLRSDVSMESAKHYAELTAVHLNGINCSLPSVESAQDPQTLVKESMESVISVLKNSVRFLIGHKKKDPMAIKAASEDLRFVEDLVKDIEKKFGDKSWLEKANQRTDVFDIEGRAGAVLYRGATGYNTFQEFAKEVEKDLAEYKRIMTALTPLCEAYGKWAAKTWVDLENAYKATHNDPVALKAKAVAILKEQVAKVPPQPSTKYAISEASRLGFPGPDKWWTQNSWGGKNNPDAKSIQVQPITKAEVAKALLLLEEVSALSLAVYEKDDILTYTILKEVEGFDDYPFRDDTMWEAVSEVGKDNYAAYTFDMHWLYDGVLGWQDCMTYRLEWLQKAIYHWLSGSMSNGQ